MRRVWVATAAAKATLSMPSPYPDGNRMLSYPADSAATVMARQWSQLLARPSSGTPRNS